VSGPAGAASLRVDRAGRVVVFTIDRPEVRNAFDPATLWALADAIDAATSGDDAGAAVLTGAGSICFSSGMDLRAVRSDPQAAGEAVRRFHESMNSSNRLPIVAAVRGMAVGGGFELMLQCDLVVAAETAVFGLPEVKRGLVPGGGGLLLPARLPLAVALEIGLLGDFLDSPRAAGLGLVNRVCPDETVLDTAVEVASRLAEHPPATLARIRQLMWITAMEGPRASIAAADALPRTPELAAEAAAGIARFLAKTTHPA
jgi:enoyl-CoA hydratase